MATELLAAQAAPARSPATRQAKRGESPRLARPPKLASAGVLPCQARSGRGRGAGETAHSRSWPAGCHCREGK